MACLRCEQIGREDYKRGPYVVAVSWRNAWLYDVQITATEDVLHICSLVILSIYASLFVD